MIQNLQKKKDIFEILDILRPYCVDNKMILCKIFKSFDAPYESCKVSFDDCDNDFIYSLPDDYYDEVIDFFEDYCRKFYADEDGLYPGGRIITYIDMDGNITYKKK